MIDLLNEIYHGPAWHGPSVKESLRGVSASPASKKLAPDRNSIWELVLHLAHGRHLLTERVKNASVAAFPRKIRTPWWPEIDYEMDDAAWNGDLQLLDDCHVAFIAAVEAATPEQLDRIPKPGDQPIRQQLVGMAVHDGYHAGQIQLLALQFGDKKHSP
jgi:hypothetical protein